MLGRARDSALKEGSKLRVLTTAAGLGHLQPLRVILSDDGGVEAATALSDHGGYVPVDVRNIAADVAEQSEDEDSGEEDGGVRLYQSIYETALRNNVPQKVIEELIRIYSYDVDFQRKAAPSDLIDVSLFGGREQRRTQ